MRKLIEQLREKPHATRQSVALLTSGVVTVGIFVLWFVTTDLGIISGPEEGQGTVAVSEEENNLASPFSAIKDDVSELFSGVKNLRGSLSQGEPEDADGVIIVDEPEYSDGYDIERFNAAHSDSEEEPSFEDVVNDDEEAGLVTATSSEEGQYYQE